MTYTYDYEQREFTVDLDTGGKFHVNLNYETIDFNNRGIEISYTDDILKDFIVSYGKQFVTAYDLYMRFADMEDRERREYEIDAAVELKNSQELSSPYMTGRI